MATSTEDMDNQMNFDEANKQMHPVETQWHYPIMHKHGYTADTLEATGFVRTYRYTNLTTKHSMIVTTGASADHWSDDTNKAYGYWGSLDDHLAKLNR